MKHGERVSHGKYNAIFAKKKWITYKILNQNNKGKMIQDKLIYILPFQILGNMSTLLLTLVDGLVVGNIVGEVALSSVNLLSPLLTLVGALCGVIGSGVSISLSKAMVDPDRMAVPRTYKTAVYLVAVSMLIVAIIEIPAAKIIIGSYDISENQIKMVWAYSRGIMIALIIGVISTVGTNILVAIGQAKKLAFLATVEGIVNLILDLLFVGPLHLGVAGAGYGTVIANCVRATLTIAVLLKSVKIFPLIKEPCRKNMFSVFRQGSYRLPLLL